MSSAGLNLLSYSFLFLGPRSSSAWGLLLAQCSRFYLPVSLARTGLFPTPFHKNRIYQKSKSSGCAGWDRHQVLWPGVVGGTLGSCGGVGEAACETLGRPWAASGLQRERGGNRQTNHRDGGSVSENREQERSRCSYPGQESSETGKPEALSLIPSWMHWMIK